MLLAGLGALSGLVFAQVGTRVLLSFMELQANPVSFSLTPDIRVLVFTMGAALSTGMLLGLAPAFRGSRNDLAFALKGSSAAVTGRASRQRLNQALVVTQVALSLVLLIGAGLFVRTLRNLKGADMGFDRENVVQFTLEFTERVEPRAKESSSRCAPVGTLVPQSRAFKVSSVKWMMRLGCGR